MVPVASNPTNISSTISGHVLTLSWPADHLGWLMQSNSVSVANTNSWYDIPGSEAVTSLNIPMTQPQTYFRLRHP